MLLVVIIRKVFIMFNIQLQGCDGKKLSDKSDDKKCFPDKAPKTRVKSVKKANKFNSIKSKKRGLREI